MYRLCAARFDRLSSCQQRSGLNIGDSTTGSKGYGDGRRREDVWKFGDGIRRKDQREERGMHLAAELLNGTVPALPVAILRILHETLPGQTWFTFGLGARLPAMVALAFHQRGARRCPAPSPRRRRPCRA